MFRFVVLTLFILAVHCSAVEETQDKRIENFCIFGSMVIILLLIVNVIGFVLIIYQNQFVQSNFNKVSQTVNELGQRSGAATERLCTIVVDLGKGIGKMAEGTQTSFTQINRSFKEFTELLRPILAIKRDAFTEPMGAGTWVDLELGTAIQTPAKGPSMCEDLEDLEEEPFYYF